MLEFEEALIHSGNKDCLHFFYGTNDGWSPERWAEGMQERLPPDAVVVDAQGFEHAFVLRHSEGVAAHLAGLIASKHQC